MSDEMRSARPTIPSVVARFTAYLAGHPSWGVLHNVLEDQNVSDTDVRWCRDHATEQGDEEGAALASILLTMSRTQRLKLARSAVAGMPDG